MEEVILVDENDKPIGTIEKIQAHLEGRLHRAVSVFIFNQQGAMLLQQRALKKYHSGGLWSNACCSHPRPGESTTHAASRRLFEETGIRTALEFKTTFIYNASFENGLQEYELDHVFFGTYDQDPILDPREASDFRWQSIEEIRKELKKNQDDYTAWFKIALEQIFPQL